MHLDGSFRISWNLVCFEAQEVGEISGCRNPIAWPCSAGTTTHGLNPCWPLEIDIRVRH